MSHDNDYRILREAIATALYETRGQDRVAQAANLIASLGLGIDESAVSPANAAVRFTTSWFDRETGERNGRGPMTDKNPDLIGQVEVDGVIYEIDWPHRLDEPGLREDFALVYRDGEILAEFLVHDGTLDEEDVIEAARDFIEGR